MNNVSNRCLGNVCYRQVLAAKMPYWPLLISVFPFGFFNEMSWSELCMHWQLVTYLFRFFYLHFYCSEKTKQTTNKCKFEGLSWLTISMQGMECLFVNVCSANDTAKGVQRYWVNTNAMSVLLEIRDVIVSGVNLFLRQQSELIP